VPDLDLPAVCKRARERNPNVFIILASEQLDFAFLQDALTAHANEVLALPTDRQEVRSLVEKAGYDDVPRTEKMPPTGLAALQEFNLRINSCHALDETLELVMDKCLATLDAVSGSVFIHDDESGELVLKVAAGPCSESLPGVRQKIGSGIAGVVAQSRQPLLVTDIATEPQFKPKDSERYQTGSFLSVPLVSGDQLVGVICASDKTQGASFTARGKCRGCHCEAPCPSERSPGERAAQKGDGGAFGTISRDDRGTGLPQGP
jgi:putative methionine-R-sulfoxide reductase with GAF domain